MKIWKTIFYFLAIIPWPFIVSIMTFYFKAGQVLGHGPSYNNPDPKELDIYKVYSPYVDWTAEVWGCSLLVWFALAITYLIIMRKRIEWTPLIISSTGQIFGILLLFSGIMEWYVD
jgi:hypothetical protein